VSSGGGGGGFEGDRGGCVQKKKARSFATEWPLFLPLLGEGDWLLRKRREESQRIAGATSDQEELSVDKREEGFNKTSRRL